MKEIPEAATLGVVSSLLPLPTKSVPPTPTRTASAPPSSTHSGLVTPPLAIPNQALHILVVEVCYITYDDYRLWLTTNQDNLINQKILAQQLRRQGCTVSVANHGLEALSYIKTTHLALNPEKDADNPAKPPQPLSLILLDLVRH